MLSVLSVQSVGGFYCNWTLDPSDISAPGVSRATPLCLRFASHSTSLPVSGEEDRVRGQLANQKPHLT
jgi:hypothetical protein